VLDILLIFQLLFITSSVQFVFWKQVIYFTRMFQPSIIVRAGKSE